MSLAEAIDRYLSLKRSLGAVYSAEARILRSLCRTLGDIAIEEVDPDAVRTFIRGSGQPTRWQERKHQTLRGFFGHLVSRGRLSASPLPEPTPLAPRSFQPRIYSHEELRRLLDATEILDRSDRPLRRETYRTLLLTLYAAGLRPGEGLRLRCCDVDLDEGVLFIWDTKFFKSRLVPVGAALQAALRSYAHSRQDLPLPSGTRSFFFASPHGGPISLASLESVFVRLRERAGVCNPPQARWQPRLQDLRHSFATHRLIAWYREGADLHNRLLALSVYLGHASPVGTQTYLSMTPELLVEASQRFERYAAPGAAGDMP